jgi:hypothetical protein
MGRTAMFPICLTEGSSLKAEWYAYPVSRVQNLLKRVERFQRTGIVVVYRIQK